MVGTLHRFERADPIFKNLLYSKFCFKSQKGSRLLEIYVSAGPFRTGEVSLEHGFILSTVTNSP